MKLRIIGSLEDVRKYGTSSFSQLLRLLDEKGICPETPLEMLEAIAMLCEDQSE